MVQFVPNDEAGWRGGYQARGVRFFVYYDDDVGWATYPPETNTWLPKQFRVEAEGVRTDELPYRVRMEFVVENGRPMCIELALGRLRADLTSEGLRKVPVSRLVRDAALAAVHESPDSERSSPRALQVGRWARLYASDNPPHRPTGKRLDDAHYRRVAKIYEQARLAGADPVAAVKAHEFCSRSTAGRWVGEARERGFLAKTTPGKPSDVLPPKRSTRITKET